MKRPVMLKKIQGQVLKNFIHTPYICGLDLGSQTVKASLLQIRENGEQELLGVFETKTNGFKEASVRDMGELAECVHTVVAGLSENTGVKIQEVYLGVGSGLVKASSCSAVIPLGDRGSKVITAKDVAKVRLQARLLGVNMEELILQDLPQLYFVDDVNKALNPVGLYGRKLEIKTLLIVANNGLIKNLTTAINHAGYDVPYIYFSSWASSGVELTGEQKQKGCAYVNIGAAVTDILIFHEGVLKAIETVSLGGEHVTRRIAEDLDIVLDLAEEIKNSYAFASGEDPAGQEEILIKREEGYLPIKKQRICHAIEPVIANQVETILQGIRSSQFYEFMNCGIILSGGGALLPGLAERIEQTTTLPVKVGQIQVTAKRLSHAPKFAASVGVALAGAEYSHRNASSSTNGHAGWPGRVVNKVRELYNEYF